MDEMAVRGLEAWATLPPSENHLRGDFKNISVMLQDKSLIIGNYGLPISPSSLFFCQSFCVSPALLLSSHSTGRAWLHGLERERGVRAITWEQRVIMAADALLHFHSCGVAHLWAAITDQMIPTGPCDEVATLTEWLAALTLLAPRVVLPHMVQTEWSFQIAVSDAHASVYSV